MSDKVKYVFNPFSENFDAISESAKRVADIRNCLSTVAVGDIVMESDIIVNGVESTVDNADLRPAIGIVLNKPSTTTCEVLFAGTIGGFVGLNKGTKIFLDTDGSITSTAVTSGYLQCLGTARDVDTVDFNPQLNRVKRT